MPLTAFSRINQPSAIFLVTSSVCENDIADGCSGQNAVFVYDPDDASNRPVRGIHDNIIKFWRIYPDYIKDAFIRSFTTGISDPTKRIIENEWQKLFIRLRSEIIQCGCGRTNFSSMFIHQNEKTFKCPKCGMEFVTIGFSNRDYRTPLYLGCKFYT